MNLAVFLNRMIAFPPHILRAAFAFALGASAVQAHEYPAEFQILAGTTNTFTVADQGSCAAYVSATVNSPQLVTVTPNDGFGVSVPFTIIAGTNTGNTTVTIQWVGSDAFAGTPGPCQEDTRPGGRIMVVRVIDPQTNSTANNPSHGPSGDPVNTFNGELYFHEKPDLDLGGPLPLIFQRYYASRLRKNFVVGNLGDNWRHNFEWRIHWVGNLIVLVTDTGKVLRYLKEGNDWVLKTPTDSPYQLVQQGQQIILGDARSHRTYRFDAAGRLAEISDGRGNSLLLTYVNALLDSVSENTSFSTARRIQFFYNSSAKMTFASAYYGSTFAYNISFSYTGENLTSYVNPLSQTTQYVYDTTHADPGLLKWTVRPRGNIAWQQTWDEVGKVATQTDALGNVTSFNYGPPQSPGLTIVTNPLNQVTTFIHDSNGSLVSVTDPGGKTTSFVTGTNRLRSQITNPEGLSLNRSLLGSTGAITSETDENGNQTAYVYSPRTLPSGIVFQDLTTVVYPDGTSERFQYDASGNLINHTNQAGHVWSYTYNTNGQPLTIRNPLGGITTNLYDGFRNLVSSRDPSGNVTTNIYDSFRRLTRITWADSTSRTFQYDNLNNLLVRTDERTNSIRMSYDANGNLTRITNRLQRVTALTYDAMDRLTVTTFPIGNAISNSYDALGRVATMTSPAGNVIAYSYNARNQEIAVSDSMGLVKSNAFSNAGWLLSSWNALGQMTSYSRDAAGRLKHVTSPGGRSMEIGYDAMDRPRTAALGGVSSQVTFDARGLPTAVMLPGGTIGAQYSFDGLGRLTQLIDGNSRTWSRQYDVQGRLTSVTDPAGNITAFTYNNRNRVSQMSFPGGLGSVSYSYDGVGNLTRALYSDGTDLVYAYDQENQLTNGNNLTLGYDAKGRITNCNALTVQLDAGRRISRITYTNGVYVDYTYNVRDQVTRITDWLGGQTDFSYDAGGRLTNISRPNLVQTIYTYDADNHLGSIEERKNPSQLSLVTLVRDDRGHLASEMRSGPSILPALSLSSADRSFTYTVSSQNAAQTHDAIGRITSDGARTYAWNLASRLTGWTHGSTNVTFTYDGFGHRISRNDGVSHVQYVWNYAFARPCIAIIRNASNGSVIQYNVCTPDGELLYAVMGDNSRRFYHFDEMGNTSFISDGTGTPIVAYRYTPLGEVLTDSSGGSVANAFCFQGRYSVLREGATALYYMRARYYDGATGRFLSRDPIQTPFPQFLNPYQYAGGNPLLFRDPSGQEITATDVAQGAANGFATAIGTAPTSGTQSLVDAAASKLGRIADAAGNGPGAQALRQNANNISKASKALNNVGYGAAVASAALEANDLSDRLDEISRRRRAEENRLINSANNAYQEVRELYRQKKITLAEYERLLRQMDAAFIEQLTANSDIGFVDTALESTKSLLKSVAGIAPIPGGAWDSFFNWLER